MNLPEDWASKVNQVLCEDKLSLDVLFIRAMNLYLYQMNARKIRCSLLPLAEKAGIHTEEELFEQIS